MSEQLTFRLADTHAFTLREICKFTDEALSSYCERVIVAKIESDLREGVIEQWKTQKEKMDKEIK
jgi:hypothetical protein